jgi:mannose-6-phosphate isomerase-like protein (cupin superfamily)
MAPSVEVHTFDKPDEVRQFGNGHLEILQTGGGEVGRSVFEPGWRWSNDVKPIAQTDSCQVHHLGYSLSGTLHVEMDGGDSMDIGPGSVAIIPPGHDAWVVGDEPVVIIDWAGSSTYAKGANS